VRLAKHHARLLVIAVCACVAGGIATAGGAEDSNLFRQRADALRNANNTLATRLHGAVLGLYSLDAELDRARSRLAALESRRNDIAARQRAIRMRLDTARQDLRISQRRLAVLVHTMYEQDATDPLAVILGAESLEDALATLDDLARSATQHSQVAAQSRTARDALQSITGRLARESAKIRALEDDAARAAASLEATRAERRRYIASLAAERNLNEAQIARLDSRARASVEQSLAVSAAASAPTATPTPTPTPKDAEAAPAPGTAHTMTVVATGYAASGATATGLSTGWGTVAVDPSVIPLGTRMTIPGYGQGVAADTGGGVSGGTIDLWFPTTAEALRWGRRVVTITLH
jgi:3D (Asp-Asp-Asp) domain-containing protein